VRLFLQQRGDTLTAQFGGTFAGHGVYVTGGNARFILKQYSVSK